MRCPRLAVLWLALLSFALAGHCQQQFARGLVDRHFQRLCPRYPTELARFVIQSHLRTAHAPAGVIEQNKMRIAIKFFRVNAILSEHKLNVADLEVRLLFDFSPQSIDRGLAPLDFSAGTA